MSAGVTVRQCLDGDARGLHRATLDGGLPRVARRQLQAGCRSVSADLAKCLSGDASNVDWATLDEGIAGLESYLQALRLDPALNQGDGDGSHEIEMAALSLQLGHCYQCRYEYVKAAEQFGKTFFALEDIIADAATSSSSQTVASMHLAVATTRYAEINRLLGGDVDLSLAMLRECCLKVPQEDFATPQCYAHLLVEARGAVAVAEAAEVLDTILHQDQMPQDIAPSDLAILQTNYRLAAIMAGQFAASRGDLEAASRYFTMEWAFVVAKGPLQERMH